MELSLAAFADLAGGISPQQRMRNLMEEAELADQLGLDVFRRNPAPARRPGSRPERRDGAGRRPRGPT